MARRGALLVRRRGRTTRSLTEKVLVGASWYATTTSTTELTEETSKRTRPGAGGFSGGGGGGGSLSGVQHNPPRARYDYRSIRDHAFQVRQNMVKRNVPAAILAAPETVAALYDRYRTLVGQVNTARERRNENAQRFKRVSESSRQDLFEDGRRIKIEVSALEEQIDQVELALKEAASLIPNDTHPDVPIGEESNARVVETFGPPIDDPLTASLKARDHLSIARLHDIVDFDAGVRSTGSAWPFLRGWGASLSHALESYALSIAVKNGYTPVSCPDVVRADVTSACGFRPRDNSANLDHQVYKIEQRDSQLSEDESQHSALALAATAEIPLAGSLASTILVPESLPLRMVGIGRAFRKEAGARGADSRGLYRVHQFTKVEMFVACEAESHEQSGHAESQSRGPSGDDILREIVTIQKEICQGLDLSCRILDMPSHELGHSAYRKFDIEAWMPGRGSFGEITSASHCTDFQSRRLSIRYRPASTMSASSPPTEFAHTLNGTAAAIPRLVVALLEVGYLRGLARGLGEGSIVLPGVLRRFWIGPLEAAGEHEDIVILGRKESERTTLGR